MVGESEAEQIIVPMDSDFKETYALGLAVDAANRLPSKGAAAAAAAAASNEQKSNSDVFPAVFMLTTEGRLHAYQLMTSHPASNPALIQSQVMKPAVPIDTLDQAAQRWQFSAVGVAQQNEPVAQQQAQDASVVSTPESVAAGSDREDSPVAANLPQTLSPPTLVRAVAPAAEALRPVIPAPAAAIFSLSAKPAADAPAAQPFSFILPPAPAAAAPAAAAPLFPAFSTNNKPAATTPAVPFSFEPPKPAASPLPSASPPAAVLPSALPALSFGPTATAEKGAVAAGPNMMLGRGLAGLTLGLVGHGRIGQAVERLAGAHGMEVVHTTRTSGAAARRAARHRRRRLAAPAAVRRDAPPDRRARARADEADGRAREHQPRADRGRGGARSRASPRDDRGRGARRLRARAGGDRGLLELENVILVPHLGSATLETREAMGMLCVEALRAVLLEGRRAGERRQLTGGGGRARAAPARAGPRGGTASPRPPGGR